MNIGQICAFPIMEPLLSRFALRFIICKWLLPGPWLVSAYKGASPMSLSLIDVSTKNVHYPQHAFTSHQPTHSKSPQAQRVTLGDYDRSHETHYGDIGLGNIDARPFGVPLLACHVLHPVMQCCRSHLNSEQGLNPMVPVLVYRNLDIHIYITIRDYVYTPHKLRIPFIIDNVSFTT